MPFKSHEEYMASQSAEVRGILEQIQKEVEARIPGAERTISYNMPAYKKGRTFFYFAAFKKHIGIYPPVTEDLAIIDQHGPIAAPRATCLSHTRRAFL